MNERNTIHSRLPTAMPETEAGPHGYSSQTPAGRTGDSRHESCQILVHTGDSMSGPFAALRPRGLSGGLISLAAAIALLYYGRSKPSWLAGPPNDLPATQQSDDDSGCGR
jgi:hypothetical protein